MICDREVPTEPILRQMLQEGPTSAIRAVTGWSVERVSTLRERLDAPCVISAAHSKAAGKLFRQRWAAWWRDPTLTAPEAVTPEELFELAMGCINGWKRPKCKPKPGEAPDQATILKAARKLCAKGRPTDEDIARATGYTERQVYGVLFTCRGNLSRSDDGHYSFYEPPERLDYRIRPEELAGLTRNRSTSPWQGRAKRVQPIIRFLEIGATEGVDRPLKEGHKPPAIGEGWPEPTQGGYYWRMFRCEGVTEENGVPVYVMRQITDGFFRVAPEAFHPWEVVAS